MIGRRRFFTGPAERRPRLFLVTGALHRSPKVTGQGLTDCWSLLRASSKFLEQIFSNVGKASCLETTVGSKVLSLI